MNVDYALIGKRIKAERMRQGLTQEVMAERLDVTIGYVSQVERGITKISLDLLAKIATVLNCDIAGFVTNSSIENDAYLSDEINREIRKLGSRDKKLVMALVRALLEAE